MRVRHLLCQNLGARSLGPAGHLQCGLRFATNICPEDRIVHGRAGLVHRQVARLSPGRHRSCASCGQGDHDAQSSNRRRRKPNAEPKHSEDGHPGIGSRHCPAGAARGCGWRCGGFAIRIWPGKSPRLSSLYWRARQNRLATKPSSPAGFAARRATRAPMR